MVTNVINQQLFLMVITFINELMVTNVSKAIVNNTPKSTTFMGGINHQKYGWFTIVFLTLVGLIMNH